MKGLVNEVQQNLLCIEKMEDAINGVLTRTVESRNVRSLVHSQGEQTRLGKLLDGLQH